MNRNKPFPTDNHKDHFSYDNRPFINPEHGELQPIEWATVIDTSLISSSDPSDDDFVIPPEYFLQVTPTGEIRGITHEYDEHEEYFSVTADGTDVIFLKLFLDQFPHLTPSLTSLLYFRKQRMCELRKYVDEYKEEIMHDD
jgi:hypothetical protein